MRGRPVAEKACRRRHLPESQSGGFADSPALDDMRYAAGDEVDDYGRQPDGAADQSDFRVAQVTIRGAGQQKLPSASRSIRPSWSPRLSWRTSEPIASPGSTMPREYRWRDPQLHDLCHDSVAEGQGLETRHHRYRNGGPLRVRDIERDHGPEDAKQWAWADGKRGVFLVVFKQPAPTSSTPWTRFKAAAARG